MLPMHLYFCFYAGSRCARTALCTLRCVTVVVHAFSMPFAPVWPPLIRSTAPPPSCDFANALCSYSWYVPRCALCTLLPHTACCCLCTFSPHICDIAIGATPTLSPVTYPSQPPTMVAADPITPTYSSYNFSPFPL